LAKDETRKETYSSLSTYLLCQQKYYWQEVLQIEPDVPIFRPLFFGRVIHDCLEIWHQNRNIDIALTRLGKHYQGQEEAERTLAEVMIRSYANKYKQEDFIIIEAEKKFDMPFGDPDNSRRKKFRLGGRRDMVIDTGMDTLLMEHKTAAQVDGNYIDRLQTDFQIALYSSTYHKVLSGCLYNILIKPRIKHGDNLDTYRERLEDIYATKNMFQRVNVWWTDNDYLVTKRQTYLLFKAIQQSRKSGIFLRNTSQCFYYQRKCMYHELCRNMENAQFIIESSYRIRPEHQELIDEGGSTNDSTN